MSPAEANPVVTGIGLVTPLGWGLAANLEALSAGRGAVEPAETAPEGWSLARVPEFDPRPHFRIPKAIKLTDRRTKMAVVAASMALADAGAADGDLDPERFGVIVGTSGSDLQADELGRAMAGQADRAAADIPYFSERILADLNPLWLIVNLPNMVSAHIAIQLDARGPNSVVMTDWVAGLQAVAEGAEWVRSGEADAVLAGGAEAGILPFVMSSYAQAGLGGPGGLALADGAAVVLIEDARRAAERGARVYGEVLSADGASGSDEGAVPALRAIREELDRRGARLVALSRGEGLRRPAGIDAWAEVFGAERAASPPEIVDYRSALGHALAASPAIDAALLLARLPAERPPAAVVCGARGYRGQFAALAFAGRAA
jgi:3-oxoacyl-[acyl-carrier-protein] synthase II